MAYNKIIIAIVLLFLSMFAGWKLNTYYTGYQLSQAQQVQKVVDDGIRKIEASSAKVLNEKIDELKEQDWKVREITKQPIYQNQCIDEAGINQLKANKDKINEIRKRP